MRLSILDNGSIFDRVENDQASPTPRVQLAMKALCIRCGTIKSRIWRPCSTCGFDPRRADEESMLRSVYLSTVRFDEPSEQRRYANELDHISDDIRNGRQINFEPEELRRLLVQKRVAESVRTRDVLWFLARIFAPAVGIIAALWLLYAVLALFR
jgi:hypothetical protein